MEIGIDALPLMGRGGISRHLIDLLPALLDQGGGHRFHLFARVFRRARRRRYLAATRAFHHSAALTWHTVFVPDRLLEFAWSRHDIVLPGTRRYLKGMDVFLDTTGLVPAGSPRPVVSVVHDLVPLRFPQWYHDHALVRRRLEKQIRRSSLIIAVSESTGRDLQHILKVPAENIRVVHHGIDARFRRESPERIEAVLRTRDLSRPYFLYVGGSGPIKNLDTLLEGFRRFRQSSKDGSALLLGGDLRWAPDLPRDLERLGLGGDVRSEGFIGDEELLALYSGATAVVVPSRHESFGFPALEAMACGTPVVATRVGALPELLGDDALYFDPDRPNELAEILSQISTDEKLRLDLGRRGVARASTFTWARAARETLDVLAEASREAGPRRRRDGEEEPGEH